MDTLVEYAVDGQVARLTLNSPHNRNALSTTLVGQLHQGLRDAANDPAKTGRLDHIAFACEGLKAMKSNLEQHSIKYDERVLPRLNMTQLFYYDPDGIAVECNFPAAETVAR